ncbi:MAG TPA: tRNA glutamyl-Q(34) synthetase GluQRS [Hydrogenophaga sp.]|nr:tRNA glutamyl-Q(34) synthetase GluQRS [Hydrogenophaga sp.]
MTGATTYRGRFAPSPTGPLHAGSLVAALASWLDARAHGGTWLVRMEDVDTPRCVPGADHLILQQLAACGMHSDEPVVWQSQRVAMYQRALDRLIEAGHAYPCGCSRKDIETALQAQGLKREKHQMAVYPGTCRPERGGLGSKPARAWRFACPSGRSHVSWSDRRLGAQQQDVPTAVGDFVLLRGDGLWAYQQAVVVDDANQGITCVVRGEDLADNTPRQILLQQALALPTPTYLHTMLVRDPRGDKLSKQTGATALDLVDPAATLNQAARCLDLPAAQEPVPELLSRWVQAWQERWG